jgi:hypothetical protein
MTGCRKHRPGSDLDDDWKYDVSLPVPINFGTASLTKGGEVTTLDDLDLGIFGLEHGAPTAVNWTSGQSVLLYNITGRKGADNMIELVGGPYYYPLNNHINYAFYGYYPIRYANGSPVSISQEDDALVATMQIKDNVDILWGSAVATTVKGKDGGTYSGFNGRYIRKVVKDYPEYAPTLPFEHKTTNIVFNAKAKGDLTEDEFAKFNSMGFKITGITVNPITNTDDDNNTVEKKIARYAKLYLAVKNGTSPLGHKSGDLVPWISEGDLGRIDIPVDNLTFPEKNINYPMGQFFLVPFEGAGNDMLNVSVTYTTTVNGSEKKSYFDVPIDISGKKFEAGKKYIYNIIFYPPEQIRIGVVEDALEWEIVGDEDGVDIDQG